MISTRESGIRPPGTLLATPLLMSGKFVNKLVVAYVGFEKIADFFSYPVMMAEGPHLFPYRTQK